jgi:hypothetical protein
VIASQASSEILFISNGVTVKNFLREGIISFPGLYFLPIQKRQTLALLCNGDQKQKRLFEMKHGSVHTFGR